MDLANVLELLSKKGFIQEVDIQTIIEDEEGWDEVKILLHRPRHEYWDVFGTHGSA